MNEKKELCFSKSMIIESIAIENPKKVRHIRRLEDLDGGRRVRACLYGGSDILTSVLKRAQVNDNR